MIIRFLVTLCHSKPIATNASCILVTGFLVTGLLVACAPLSPNTARNAPICPDARHTYTWSNGNFHILCLDETSDGVQLTPAVVPQVPRARAEFASGSGDVPATFVGLSISGGGSRAAVFGMEVMRQLHELGILQHVTAISTTSGGGLAGAHYALNGPNMNWDNAGDLMAKDYLGKWVGTNFRLLNLVSVVTTNEDRSDLMAEVFDQELFHGKTYSDLGPFSPGSRPIWLANATEVGEAKRFTFAEEQFRQINSDLSSYPISHAVMASAAFPGVFNSVTLRDYVMALMEDDEISVRDAIRYKHLLDGGPTDNLGIESLLELARSREVADRQDPRSRMNEISHPGNCLFIIVDAHPKGVPSRYDLKEDLRGATGRLLDMNFLDAIDALLVARRTDLLGYLGLEDSGKFGRRNTPQFVYVDLPMMSSRISHALRVGIHHPANPEWDPVTNTLVHPVPIGYFRCAAWHINLSGLEAIEYYERNAEADSPIPVEAPLEIERQRALHELLVSQIDTNFRIKGPEGCEAAFLTEALREAAAVLVTEDYESQRAVCDWLRHRGLEVTDTCGFFLEPASIKRLPMHGTVWPVDMESPGGPITEAVRCIAR